jgi:hypothetical protein
MVGFTKLHAVILDSSIWLAPPETRCVWIAMLAMANRDGVVEASVGGLAHRANVSIEACRLALEAFEGPDPDSRDGTTGERIEKVPGGWLILNHANYRDLQTREQKLTAERVRRHREKEGVSALRNAEKRSPASASEIGSAESEGGFEAFWQAFDHKQKRPRAERAWRRIDPDDDLAATIIAKAKAYAKATPDKAYRAHPATWLNDCGWNDDLPQPPKPKFSKPSLPPQNVMVPLAHLSVPHEHGNPDCQCDRCISHRRRDISEMASKLAKEKAQ